MFIDRSEKDRKAGREKFKNQMFSGRKTCLEETLC